MTDAEMVAVSRARLTALATRALEVHLTKRTREHVLRMHNHWSLALSEYRPTHTPLDPATRSAFLELMEATELLINERGYDPDSMLHWLDMFPGIVLGVYLKVEQPHMV